MSIIAIAPIHRRLAELQFKANHLGGWQMLNESEQLELQHCLQRNADVIHKLDELKQLSYIAYSSGDVEWHHEICGRIERIEEQF